MSDARHLPLYVKERDMPPRILRLRQCLDRWEVLAKLKQQAPADTDARKEEATAYVALMAAACDFVAKP